MPYFGFRACSPLVAASQLSSRSIFASSSVLQERRTVPSFVGLLTPNKTGLSSRGTLVLMMVWIPSVISLYDIADNFFFASLVVVERCKGGIAELFTGDLVNRTEESHSLWDC
jgi:hypothetical protein